MMNFWSDEVKLVARKGSEPKWTCRLQSCILPAKPWKEYNKQNPESKENNRFAYAWIQ
jgi:hypothetical protein